MIKNEAPLEAVHQPSAEETALMGVEDGRVYAYRAWLRLALSPT